MEKNKSLERPFLIFIMVAIIAACYFVFRPFLVELLVSAILVSVFYPVFKWLIKRLGGRRSLAALLMCLLVVLLLIVPLANILYYAAQQSIVAYGHLRDFVASLSGGQTSGLSPNVQLVYDFVRENEFAKNTLLGVVDYLKQWFASGAGLIIMGTTNFFVSLVMIILTMFFFFVDGEKMLDRLRRWTPLSNRYDEEIFHKFQVVSQSTIISTFVTAIAQGAIGAIGLFIVGVPAILGGVAMAFLSLIPYLGAGLVWAPISAYLLFSGQIWQGIFLAVWGAGVVGTADNLIRAYIIKGKAEVHPIFVIFSILGGIALFGFWGVVFGPLIISLAVTIMHIYELEYHESLND
jgi:predicted PurR-regulated permease PerM